LLAMTANSREGKKFRGFPRLDQLLKMRAPLYTPIRTPEVSKHRQHFGKRTKSRAPQNRGVLIAFVKGLYLKGDIDGSVPELGIFRFEPNEQWVAAAIMPRAFARSIRRISHLPAGEMEIRYVATASFESTTHF
jgi:hypothetical protein